MRKIIALMLTVASVFLLCSCMVYNTAVVTPVLEWLVTNDPVEAGEKTVKPESAVDCSRLETFIFDLKSKRTGEFNIEDDISFEVRGYNTDVTTVYIKENGKYTCYTFYNKENRLSVMESVSISKDGKTITYESVETNETYESAWNDFFYRRLPLYTGLFITEMCNKWNVSLIKCEDEEDYYVYLLDMSQSTMGATDYEYKMFIEKTTGLVKKLTVSGSDYSNTITMESRAIIPMENPETES